MREESTIAVAAPNVPAGRVEARTQFSDIMFLRFSDATSAVAFGTRNHFQARPQSINAKQALVNAYRYNGYAHARTNPLASTLSPSATELSPSQYGLTMGDGVTQTCTDFCVGEPIASVAALVSHLQQVYCGPVGVDCSHVRNPVAKKWLWRTMEAMLAGAPWPAQDRIDRLERLVAAECWERYLEDNYPSCKRFSLEGCESVLAFLDQVARSAAGARANKIVLGMSHRGRVNVLVNLMGLPLDKMEALLEGRGHSASEDWDLKYHLGANTTIETTDGRVEIFLAHNPSHLESVTPVILGMARALQDDVSDRVGREVLPIILHGDAAFTGQGVVMESLNLSGTRGYGVGGAIHVVVNNQIGFTTSDPRDARSGAYCTDVARMIDAPVLHVNADDPDHVAIAAAIAVDYRMEFGSDIVIDIVGYRRRGHNEQDLPSITQPAMQAQIDEHPTVVSRYEAALLRDNLIDEGFLNITRAKYRDRISMSASTTEKEASREAKSHTLAAAPECRWSLPVDTTVPVEQLIELVNSLSSVPAGFTPHPEIARMVQHWKHSIAGDPANQIDWRLAENLAYASLLANGYGMRISGMDVGRGTFYHRQAVWHNQTLNEERARTNYIPLRHVARDQGEFDIFDSPLAEEAVLGFEYGYSVKTARELVIWEAQYGDFVNNAQVVIDQYVSTGEAKWGYKSRLTILLPHGHEGWGPEHSNGYLGRFLQLCAQQNMRVVMPSTSGQWFHLLRRQALVDEAKPLVVFTPKSVLYDEPGSHTPLKTFSAGEFRPVIDDASSLAGPIQRIVVCSGKLYFDLKKRQSMAAHIKFALIRLEQLYPFPHAAFTAILHRYRWAKEVIWAQEEHRNHGAWHFVRDDLEKVCDSYSMRLRCVSRPPAAPSATCGQDTHHSEQQAVVDGVFTAF